jgi:glutathione S-transferase
MTKPYILYGMPGSLYTGKVRAYLRKQRIVFEERPAGGAEFRETIAPQIGRWIIPVIQTPDGMLIQDGADILDYFEGQTKPRLPADPGTAIHRVIGHVFELFGGEGMLRPAMHYRWNFDDQNLKFLFRDFTDALAPGATEEGRQAIFSFSSSRMRNAAGSFGVKPETYGLIEAAYVEFLHLFDAHLAEHPYLLGARPTLGVYGLIAPLYAHLARDPAPSVIMKQEAPRVWRWVERMQTPEDFPGDGPHMDLIAEREMPATLARLLAFVAQDYLVEITAQVAFANDWLAAHPGLQAGTNGLKRPGDRGIGTVGYPWRGVPIETGVLPYRFYLLQRITDAFGACDPSDQAWLRTEFGLAGLAPILDLRTARRVLRHNHLEVWGEA